MPFDDLLTPVAIPVNPRHDEPTCCGERHVTECRPTGAGAEGTSQVDVGEGWRELEIGEVAGHADQWWHHIRHCWIANTFDGINVVSSNSHRYRRRVTPEEQPLGACLDEENNELRQQVATLTAEVERLRLTEQELKAVKYFAGSNWTTFHPLSCVLDSLLRRWGIVI